MTDINPFLSLRSVCSTLSGRSSPASPEPTYIEVKVSTFGARSLVEDIRCPGPGPAFEKSNLASSRGHHGSHCHTYGVQVGGSEFGHNKLVGILLRYVEAIAVVRMAVRRLGDQSVAGSVTCDADVHLSGEGREMSINGHGFGGALHFDHQESVWYASGIAIRLADHFAHWSDFFATDADGQV